MALQVLFDALAMKFREMKLRKDEDCVLCGSSPTVTKLIDYNLDWAGKNRSRLVEKWAETVK